MRLTEIAPAASLRLRCTPTSGTAYDFNHTQEHSRLPEGAKTALACIGQIDHHRELRRGFLSPVVPSVNLNTAHRKMKGQRPLTPPQVLRLPDYVPQRRLRLPRQPRSTQHVG